MFCSKWTYFFSSEKEEVQLSSQPSKFLLNFFFPHSPQSLPLQARVYGISELGQTRAICPRRYRRGHSKQVQDGSHGDGTWSSTFFQPRNCFSCLLYILILYLNVPSFIQWRRPTAKAPSTNLRPILQAAFRLLLHLFMPPWGHSSPFLKEIIIVIKYWH